MPHVERSAGGIGITGNEKIHPSLHRLLTGRESTILDLSPIFGNVSRRVAVGKAVGSNE